MPLLLLLILLLVEFFAVDEVQAKENFVSVSYVSVVNCFPELKDERLSNKFNLNELKEKIDSKYVTTLSQMLSRVITYSELTGERKRISMVTDIKKIGKPDIIVSMEKFDDAKMTQPMETPANLKKNPPQKELNAFLTNVKIESDIMLFNDSKYHNLKMKYQKDRLKILDLELNDPNLKVTLSCDERPDLGIVCTCKK